MSSTRSATPLRIEPRPSAILTRLIKAGHLLAMVSVPFLNLPLLTALLLEAGLAFSGWQFLRKDPRDRLAYPQTMVWTASGQWLIVDPSGTESRADLRATSVLWPALVGLDFRLESGGRRSVLLLRDSLDQETFRRLKVRLRTEGLGDKSQ